VTEEACQSSQESTRSFAEAARGSVSRRHASVFAFLEELTQVRAQLTVVTA
jgi:hypothetical protein